VKQLLSLVFILICIPSHAANEAYQQQTADLIAILKNIETQNKQLQTEVDAYTKENPKKASKAEVRPRPKVDQKPPTLLTPMDRKAMSSAIFFAGGAPRPIPQKRANNFRSPIKSDTSSNSGTNKDNPSTDDQSDSKDSDSSDSSTSSGYSSYSGGGGYYPTNHNTQMTISFIASNTTDPTYIYTVTETALPATITFTFPPSNLSLSQNTIQTYNGLTTSLTSVDMCDSAYNNCKSAGIISDNTLNITNTFLNDNTSLLGYKTSTSSPPAFLPVFYFLGKDGSGNNYKYKVNYPNSSGNLTCVPNECTQNSRVLLGRS